MSSNDYLNSLNRFKSIEDLRKLKVNELKSILKNSGESTGGKKEDLVLRCFVLVERSKVEGNTSDSHPLPNEAHTESSISTSTRL